MTNTPIDRESVHAVAAECRFVERELNNGSPMTCHKGRVIQETIDTLLALRAALDAAEAKNKRLREALMRIQHENQQQDENAYWKTRDGYWAAIARAALQENPDG